MAFPSLPRRVSRRLTWRAASAALLATALTATAAPGALPGIRSVEEGTSVIPETTPSIIVSPTTPVIEESNEEVVFTVIVRNTGTEALAAGDLTLEVNPQRVETIAGLDEEFPVSGSTIGDARVGETAPDSEQTVSITVGRDDLPFSATTAPGVYQVRSTFTPDVEAEALVPEATDVAGAKASGEAEPSNPDAAAGTGVLHSAVVPIVWRGSGGPDLELSVIVPFVLPSDVRTLPTRDQLSEAVPRLDRLLTAATAQRATLAIDPRIIAGIRAYGDESSLDAQRLLNRLESSSLPAFLLQFADADPAAQAALGFTTLLEPTNLDFVSRYGTFSQNMPDDTDDSTGATPPSDPPAPSPDASGEVSNVLPTLQQLLAWSEQTPMAWPAESSVDEGTVSFLEANGISSLVLTSDNVSLEGGPRAEMDSGSALVTDAPLGEASRLAVSAESETERAAALSEIAARLALAAQTEVPGVILGLDRGAVADAENPEALVEAIGELSWVEPTLHTDQPAGSASLKSADTLEERRELLRTAVNRERAVDEVGAILVHPEYLSGYQRTRLLNLFATRYAASTSDFPEVAADFRKRDAELMEGVRAISTEHTQLVGASTRVPVQLRNSLPFEAVVSVRVDPSSAALTLPERTFSDVRVRAESTEALLVPVQSRVSSGESGLVVNISDVSGDLTIYTGSLSISIRSSVETVALWSLGILATLLLGFGIWRSVRRRRQRESVTPPAVA